jgi:hypothetical protein
MKWHWRVVTVPPEGIQSHGCQHLTMRHQFSPCLQSNNSCLRTWPLTSELNARWFSDFTKKNSNYHLQTRSSLLWLLQFGHCIFIISSRNRGRMETTRDGLPRVISTRCKTKVPTAFFYQHLHLRISGNLPTHYLQQVGRELPLLACHSRHDNMVERSGKSIQLDPDREREEVIICVGPAARSRILSA